MVREDECPWVRPLWSCVFAVMVGMVSGAPRQAGRTEER